MLHHPEEPEDSDPSWGLAICTPTLRKGFSQIVAQLNNLLLKGQAQRRRDVDFCSQKAFHILSDSLMTPPILALSSPEDHIIVEMDACDR